MVARYVSIFGLIAVGASALLADDSVTESFAKTVPADGVETLKVKANGSEINVYGEDRKDIRVEWKIDYRTDSIEAVSKERDKIEYGASVDGSTCEVVLDYKKSSGWKWITGDKKPAIEMEIRVPVEMELSLKTSGGQISVENIRGVVDLKSSGGRIELEQIVGDVNAKTAGGRIDVEEVQGNVVVASSGGAIDIEETIGTVDARTSGGSISIEGGNGKIFAETTGGSISIECPDPKLERLDLSTMGGSIRIELSDTIGGHVELKTQGGSVSIDDHWSFDGEKKRSYLNGSFGDGNTIVRAYTLGGSVRLDTL
ncbi:MAG: DUF4097 family beta strand repeat-containing protein [Opitutales bacterium]